MRECAFGLLFLEIVFACATVALASFGLGDLARVRIFGASVLGAAACRPTFEAEAGRGRPFRGASPVVAPPPCVCCWSLGARAFTSMMETLAIARSNLESMTASLCACAEHPMSRTHGCLWYARLRRWYESAMQNGAT